MWRVAYDPDRRLLILAMHELVNPQDLRDIGAAQAEALSCTAGRPFRALFDLRKLFPLEEESIHLLVTLKHAVANHQGFRGMAVLTDSATVAMQQHHTRVRPAAHSDEELITTDAASVTQFLSRPLP